MSLTVCDECNHVISTKAEFCLGCGNPIRGDRDRKKARWLKWQMLMAALGLSVGVVSCVHHISSAMPAMNESTTNYPAGLTFLFLGWFIVSRFRLWLLGRR